MKIYTKAGDDGTTGLLGMGRVAKDDPRIAAYGTVDELNATLGIVRASALGGQFDPLVARLQDELFIIGSALADPDPTGRFHLAVGPELAEAIEADIDRLELQLAPLTQFILPGGTLAAAQTHLARTICRRAERMVVALGHRNGQHVPTELVAYLNRLSDLLFVLARAINAEAGVADVPWRGG